MRKIKVGVVGCGNISDLYLGNCTKYFNNLDMYACSDVDLSRAREKCFKFNIKKWMSVDALMDDPEIDIVLNLTTPKFHAEISNMAIEHGKHVYSEKPLSVTCEQAKNLLTKARQQNLRIGCAPDTFLGGGIQTMRNLIDNGYIGDPIAVFAHFADHGPESWHPDPGYYYQVGAGPLYEIGPYILTALINLVGPLKRVVGVTKKSCNERIVTSAKHFGEKIPVEVETHVTGLLEFVNGTVGTLLSSYDIWGTRLPFLEVYGSKGTLALGVPLYEFGGPVSFKSSEGSSWEQVPLLYGNTEILRGLGVSDLAESLVTGEPHRANGELGFHVLETMQGILISASTGTSYELSSACERPRPMDPIIM